MQVGAVQCGRKLRGQCRCHRIYRPRSVRPHDLLIRCLIGTHAASEQSSRKDHHGLTPKRGWPGSSRSVSVTVALVRQGDLTRHFPQVVRGFVRSTAWVLRESAACLYPTHVATYGGLFKSFFLSPVTFLWSENMKSRSLALSLLTALLAGSAYDASSANAGNQSNSRQVQQSMEVDVADLEEKRRIRADAISSLGSRLRDEG